MTDMNLPDVTTLTYDAAEAELTAIKAQLEAPDVSVTRLASMVKRAGALAVHCHASLRAINAEVEATLTATTEALQNPGGEE